MTASIKRIPVVNLETHPNNPRLFLRENIISGIAAQMTEHGGFEERHALTVRKLPSENYQIISGHQRFEAAKRVKVDEIPCFVVEMTDDEALREVLLSNAQSDLKPLEIGLHVLKTVGNNSKGGKGHKNGIRDYARNMGAGESTLKDWVCAAEVAKLAGHPASLIDYTSNLVLLHRTPESDWADLVARMLAGHWTCDQTLRYVDSIKTLKMPEDLADIFPRPVLIARFFEKHEFSQQTLMAVVKMIRDTVSAIHAHEDVIDVDAEIKRFRVHCQRCALQMLDARAVLKWQRKWLAAIEERQTKHEWHQGDWRTYLDTLKDDSVALLLTDPPYGIDYQSNRAVARKGYDKIENDGRDETSAEIRSCFQALYPKLKSNAHVLCFCHWRIQPEVWKLLVAAGYEIRGSLVWVKDMQGPGDLIGSFAPKYEHIIHAVKGSPILYQRDPDVLKYPRVTKSDHPAEKPTALLQQLMEATTVVGDLVADPFAGVASTLVAARDLKRSYWGCELVPKYFQVGASRLNLVEEVSVA